MTRSRDIADQQKNLGGAVAPFVAGKNAIINGGFDIWARGTSTTVTSGAGYTADRWNAWTFAAGGSVTTSRQTTSDTTNLPNIQYCARFQRVAGNTNTGSLVLGSPVETINSISYAGKTVTISFYARKGANYSATSNVLTFQLWTNTTTDGSLQTIQSGNTTVASLSATLTTTWQRFTATGTIGSTVTQIAPIFAYDPTGTAGANDYFEITGVQLEVGSVATPFSRAGGTIGGELSLCQRYYWRSTPGTAYAPISTFSGARDTTSVWGTIQPPVKMRTIPSSIDYSSVAVWDGFNLTAITSITAGELTNDVLAYKANVSSGLTQFRPYCIFSNASTSAYLAFNAEL